MDAATFSVLVTRFVYERVIPQFAPEGAARWLCAFGAGAWIRTALDKCGAMIPRLADGGVDVDALGAAFDSAFAASPKLSVDLPTFPALAAFGLGGTRLVFSRADADALMAVLRGATTTQEVNL